MLTALRHVWSTLRFALLSIVVVVLLFRLPGTAKLEWTSYDVRARLAHQYRPLPADPRIQILGIDDEALRVFGRWPWPRRYWADILDELSAAGAAGVFLDVTFPEPELGIARAQHRGFSLGQTLTFSTRSVRDLLTPANLKTTFGPAAAASDVTTQLAMLLTRRLETAEGQLRAFMPEPDAVVGAALRQARRRGMLAAGVVTLSGPRGPVEEMVARARARAQEWLIAHPEEPVGRLPAELGALPRRELGDLATYRELFLALDRDPELDPYSPARTPELAQLMATGFGNVQSAVLERAMRLALDASGVDPALLDPPALLARPELQRFSTRERYALAVLDQVAAMRLIALRHKIEVARLELLPKLISAQTASPPVLAICRELDALGVDTEIQDADGVLRKLPLLQQSGDLLLPSAALALHLALLHAQGGPPPLLVVEPGPRLRITPRGPGAEVVIPVSQSGEAFIHWRGRYADAFPGIGLSTLLTLATLKRGREVYFDGKIRNPEYQLARELGDEARFLALQVPAPSVSLAGLSARMRERPGGLERTLDAWLKPAFAGGPADTAEGRAPQTWVDLFGAYRAQAEQAYIDAIHAGAAKAARIADPGKRQHRAALYAGLQAEVKRFADETAALQERLRQQLGGKVCFIGNVSTSSTDLAPTPFDNLYPKVAAHAALLNTLLSGRFIERPSWLSPSVAGVVDGGTLQLPLLVLISLVIAVATTHLSSVRGALAALSVAALSLFAAGLLFIHHGVWIDAVAPILAVTITYTTVFTWRVFRTENIRKIFETYVDKRIVAVVAENEALWNELGGVEQNITAYFSDIAGFTSLSELLTAHETSAMLTDYLSPMTDIILRQDGTRDKYIGDAIVAFFGAPLPSPGHPLSGCLAALEQQQLIVELRLKWLRDRTRWYQRLREAGYELEFRVGLNSGLAKVGNFGSHASKNYTMIGDMVNLASRLEGANKEYSTLIMASEFTRAGARDRIVFRELDRLVVKGRKEPVTVYEVVARAGEVPADLAPVLEGHARALSLYRAREFAAASALWSGLLRDRPGDGPSALYVGRCAELTLHPPPEGWDGRYVMTHK